MQEVKCPLCERILGEENIDEHHLIPKAFKGKDTIRLHKICHRKIHATFTERELFQYFHTIERLRDNEEIQKFVTWVRKKAPGFYDCSDETNRRKAKRR